MRKSIESKKTLIKIATISLMAIIGLSFNACEEADEDPTDYYEQEEVVEEYYEGDNQEPRNNTEAISSNNSIDDREFVLIYYHFPSQSCQPIELKKSLAEQYETTDIITEVSNNSVTCATYGKKSNSDECISDDAGYDIDTSCIIGMNISSTKYTEKRTNKMIFLENIQESVISQFY